jgi:HSP20 family protein
VLAPAFDVKERDDAYVIEADLPGMTEKDVDVTLSNNRLTISGKREAKHERNDERMHSIERQYGAFTRSFTLPNEADTDHIQGELHEGVLSLVVPKAEKSKSTKISLGHRIKKALKS